MVRLNKIVKKHLEGNHDKQWQEQSRNDQDCSQIGKRKTKTVTMDKASKSES